MKLIIVIVLAGVVPLVIGGVVFGWGVPTILLTLTGLVTSLATAYFTAFRPPVIRLLAVPKPLDNRTDGYSNGFPMTWSIVYQLIALNNGPRPGILSEFSVDLQSVEWLPRQPRTFGVSFSNLEWQTPPNSHVRAFSYPLPLPHILSASAREKVLFRALITWMAPSPDELAADLSELHGFRITFHYRAGTEKRPREHHGIAVFNYDGIKDGLYPYWRGTDAWRHLAVLAKAKERSS